MKGKLMWVGLVLTAMIYASCQPTQDSLDEKVFDQVDKMPQFPGGPDSLTAYLQHNIWYPEVAVKESVAGTVLVEFVVDQVGKVTDVQVKESLCRACDSVAVAAMKAMPRWDVGELDGIPVNVRLRLPIEFSLGSE